MSDDRPAPWQRRESADFSGAEVGGRLDLSLAQWPDGVTLALRDAKVGGIPTLANGWAPKLDLDGFTYRSASAVEKFKDWFSRLDHYAPQPYIRSAAFALGVIQRFAAQPIAPKRSTDEPGSALQQFEYLSTVSGGGYIGSWLSAWLFQERGKLSLGGANRVVAELNGRIYDHAEVGPISNLRRDSHYLAPSFSALSPDLRSDIAAIIRNLCLNWGLLVPPMILAVLTTKALFYGLIDGRYIYTISWFVLIMIAATICFIAALSFSVSNRPARGPINASQAQFLTCDR